MRPAIGSADGAVHDRERLDVHGESAGATSRTTAGGAAPGKKRGSPDGPVRGLGLIDASLVVLFLGLTFLLAIFPLKDADFYWHLRTGDLIRKTGLDSPRRLLHLHPRGDALDRPALDLPGGHQLHPRVRWGAGAHAGEGA